MNKNSEARLGVRGMGSSTIRSFRDLEVWQKSMDLTITTYRLTQAFPREEKFGLSAQLRRCAVSIPSNIAKGQGRLNSREFKQFLGVARGSHYELQTQLQIARKLGFGDQELLDQSEDLSHRVGKMLFKLLGALREKIADR